MNELKATNASINRELSEIRTKLEAITKDNDAKDTKIKRLEDKITSLSHELRKRTSPVSNNSNTNSAISPPTPIASPSPSMPQSSPRQSPSLTSSMSSEVNYESEGADAQQQDSNRSPTSMLARTLLIGDSNLRHIKPRRLDPLGRTSVRTLPGTTINKLSDRLKNGEVQGSFKNIILHVGTNDVRNYRSPTEIVQDMKGLIKQCKSTFHNPSIAVTEILPQFCDNKRYSPVSENKNIKNLCASMNVQWIPLPIHHASNFKHDGLHLNMKGVAALAKAVRPHPPMFHDETPSNIETIVSGRYSQSDAATWNKFAVQELPQTQDQHNMRPLNNHPAPARPQSHPQGFMPQTTRTPQHQGQSMNVHIQPQPDSVQPYLNTGFFPTPDPLYPYFVHHPHFPFHSNVNNPRQNVSFYPMAH